MIENNKVLIYKIKKKRIKLKNQVGIAHFKKLNFFITSTIKIIQLLEKKFQISIKI